MKILLVDDDRDTVTSIREQLAAELDGLSVDMVETGESAIHMIDESGDSEDDSGYDLVVSADELPGMDGLELLDRVKDRDGWNIPFVLIVGREYEDAAIDAFGLGADRILRKEGDTEAQHQVLAKGIAEEARRNDGRSKDRSEAQFREILAGADEAILLINDGTFVDCNDAAAQLLGYRSGDEIVGATPAALSPPTQPDGKGSADKAETMIDMAAQGGYHRFEWLHRRADGEAQLVDVSLTPIVHDGDRMVYCVWRPAAGKTAVEQETAEPTVDAPIADAAVPRETGIRALVVDADTHRGNVLAHDVQQHADEIDVTVVSTANEAIFSLDSQAAFDCLLVTTGVPDVDAVQLIEQVRRNRPILPTLLIVETADAEVVNRAIEAGASDYVVRRSAGDAPVAIAEKVRATVEQSRLQRGVQFSLQRYRTLSEYLPDPVAFVRDGQVLFCNERFVELAGRDRDRISDREFAETVVHPEDRDRIGRVIEAWDAGDDPAATETVRIVSPDGSVRHCEVAGRAVDAEGLSGVLVSFRDVTDRKRRETELELERALFETIPEALVESRTRSAFEGDVVDALHDQGYGLVCIGEPTEDVLVPRVGRGDSTYGDALDWSITDGPNANEPCIGAARTGEARFLQDFEDLFSAPWRDVALDRGYRSGAGIPLEYRGVTYGVLGVYAREAGRFDERERRVLERFADAVAFGIHTLEMENALATDAVSEVTVTVDPDGYYLAELAWGGAFVDCDGVQVLGTISHAETGIVQYVSVAGGSLPSLRESIESHPAVSDLVVADESEPVRLQVTVTETVPEARLAAQGVVVTGTRIEPSGARITTELPVDTEPGSLAESLEEEFGSVRIRSTAEKDRGGRDGPTDWFLDANLTEKQSAALEAAYHHGYFERPRRNSATEVAEALGIAHSTFLQHLRAAERKVFRQQFD